jgi:hypothetical protein
MGFDEKERLPFEVNISFSKCCELRRKNAPFNLGNALIDPALGCAW